MMHFEGDFSTRKCIENSIESLHTEEIRSLRFDLLSKQMFWNHWEHII